MTSFTALPEVDRLARFTAAVLGAVPQFDASETPIGHALAAEFYAPGQEWTAPEREPEPVTTMMPIVAATPSAVIVELPVPAEPTHPAAVWFGAEPGFDEFDEDERLAS